MSGALALQDILVVEDDPALLEFHCPHTGVLLWPLVRFVFLRMMMSDILYNTPLVKLGQPLGMWELPRAISTLSRSVVHNTAMTATGRCRADICLMTDALGSIVVGGKHFNRLSDHFALACPGQTLVIEDQFGWKWPFPRHADKVMFHAPFQVRGVLAGRILVRRSHRLSAAELVDLVERRAKERLGWELGDTRRGQVVEMLARKHAGLVDRFRGYRAMLRRVRPRVLMVAAGCYGGAGALIAAARELGISTAESQHGAVSSGHDAYNVAPSLRDSPEYCRAMPDYLLGYGQWWMDQINVPTVKVPIGNPHRDARVAQLSGPASAGRDVLLLGDGIETRKYLEFAVELARSVGSLGLDTVFRPHPLERAATISLASSATGVRVDLRADIYESLAEAHAVVSEQSSGLFEAIGISERIFVWNTPKSRFGLPSHPFKAIDSAAELAECLRTADLGRVSAHDAAAIWAPDWRRNYLQFLASQGIRAGALH